MRNKLALTIALASFGVVTALGVGFAGAEERLDQPKPRKRRRRSRPRRQPRPCRQPACSNELDDDGDGLVDIEDPDCASPADASEEAEQPTTGTSIEAQPAPSSPAASRPVGSRPAQRSAPARARPSATTRASATSAVAAANTAAASSPQAPRRACSRRPTAPAAARLRSPTAARRPTANPTTTIAPFGPAPIGVPNFVIDSFEIPPFLLPIYQACGTEYGIPWEVLASINKIETGFGTNLNVSSAGAVGWMQFLPSSWEAFGVDANGDGRKDPYNPVDAICAAAHYLKLSGGTERPLQRDPRLQPRRLVRAGGAALRARLRQAARPTWSAR